ncbi:MAG: LytTR family DNA-binding domain-containing protein [Cyclobacteriaceae bacterium]|nr:MAG: LytTR family DNA-binding domain-containing protein [Cyclobacteriaceae bacterium]
MNVLIIEDEVPAAEKLERYLLKYDSATVIAARLNSVADAVAWLRDHQEQVDLIFMDIQLMDGLSFQIFQQVQVRKPVIFITAFNEFALDAFKVNSIDYLLKPITFTDLSNSLKKLESLREQLQWNDSKTRQLSDVFSSNKTKDYKNRFMVKLGDHIRSITTDQISLFYADGRDVYLVTTQNRKFIVDYTLETLEDLLDPAVFYRVNRTFILNIHAIKDVMMYSNSRLKISLTQEFDKEIIVSREKVNPFKEWFDGR